MDWEKEGFVKNSKGEWGIFIPLNPRPSKKKRRSPIHFPRGEELASSLGRLLSFYKKNQADLSETGCPNGYYLEGPSLLELIKRNRLEILTFSFPLVGRGEYSSSHEITLFEFPFPSLPVDPSLRDFLEPEQEREIQSARPAFVQAKIRFLERWLQVIERTEPPEDWAVQCWDSIPPNQMKTLLEADRLYRKSPIYSGGFFQCIQLAIITLSTNSRGSRNRTNKIIRSLWNTIPVKEEKDARSLRRGHKVLQGARRGGKERANQRANEKGTSIGEEYRADFKERWKRKTSSQSYTGILKAMASEKGITYQALLKHVPNPNPQKRREKKK